jgi:hypothetical protein
MWTILKGMLEWYMCDMYVRCKLGSSVGIVSGYGLDDRAIEVLNPAEAKRFSLSLCVQTMGTGSPSPELKRGRGVTLTTHPHLVQRSRMSRSYTSSPPKHLHGVWWDRFYVCKLGTLRLQRRHVGTVCVVVHCKPLQSCCS